MLRLRRRFRCHLFRHPNATCRWPPRDAPLAMGWAVVPQLLTLWTGEGTLWVTLRPTRVDPQAHTWWARKCTSLWLTLDNRGRVLPTHLPARMDRWVEELEKVELLPQVTGPSWSTGSGSWSGKVTSQLRREVGGECMVDGTKVRTVIVVRREEGEFRDPTRRWGCSVDSCRADQPRGGRRAYYSSASFKVLSSRRTRKDKRWRDCRSPIASPWSHHKYNEGTPQGFWSVRVWYNPPTNN